MLRDREMKKMFPIPPKDEDIMCPYCNKKPDELDYCKLEAEIEDMTPLMWAKENDGTYDLYTGLFTCNNCYIKMKQPTKDELFSAYPYYRMEVAPLEGQDDKMCVKYRLGEEL